MITWTHTQKKAVSHYLLLLVASKSKNYFIFPCCTRLQCKQPYLSHAFKVNLKSRVLRKGKMWSYRSLTGGWSLGTSLCTKYSKSLSLLPCHPGMPADKRSIIRIPKRGCLKSIWPEGISSKTWPSLQHARSSCSPFSSTGRGWQKQTEETDASKVSIPMWDWRKHILGCRKYSKEEGKEK